MKCGGCCQWWIYIPVKVFKISFVWPSIKQCQCFKTAMHSKVYSVSNKILKNTSINRFFTRPNTNDHRLIIKSNNFGVAPKCQVQIIQIFELFELVGLRFNWSSAAKKALAHRPTIISIWNGLWCFAISLYRIDYVITQRVELNYFKVSPKSDEKFFHLPKCH